MFLSISLKMFQRTYMMAPSSWTKEPRPATPSKGRLWRFLTDNERPPRMTPMLYFLVISTFSAPRLLPSKTWMHFYGNSNSKTHLNSLELLQHLSLDYCIRQTLVGCEIKVSAAIVKVCTAKHCIFWICFMSLLFNYDCITLHQIGLQYSIVLMPTVAVLLFCAAWLSTQQS